MRNGPISGTALLASFEQSLREKLPPNWSVEVRREPSPGQRMSPGAVVEIRAPTGEIATLVMELKNRLDPKNVPDALVQARTHSSDAVMLAAPFLSQRTREIIAGLGEGYADATGNLRIQLDRPAVFIEVSGANVNPWPERDAPLRTLKGPGAGRVVRALCEITPPYGVRELAKLSGAPASTASRVIALLEREALINRDHQSRVMTVDWKNLIRRWANDYSLTRSNRTATYIEPRGLPALLSKLTGFGMGYSVTGSLAAAARGPLTAARLGVVFVADAPLAAEQLRLREADAGANVMLAEPFGNVVFDRTWQKDGVRYAGMAQVAVDLLTGPGRGPSEGEEVVGWMEANEDAWRA